MGCISEITGQTRLTGLLGSGRSELARAIYGADRAQTGTLKVKGKEVKVKNPIG